jgi:hypothetical protein
MSGPAASLAGKSWDCWPQDECDDYSTSSSSSSSTVSSGTATPIGLPSSPSQSPLLVRRHHASSSDDVMKLPKKDMKIFGECPVRDDFLLVVCDICARCVKVEAFESHCRVRHDIVGKGSKAAALAAAVASNSARSKAAAAATSSMRSCTVELTKEDLFPLSSSSSSITAENSAATTMASSPAAASLIKEEPMEEVDVKPTATVVMLAPATSISPQLGTSGSGIAGPTPMEEADSSSANNVISIPDTDPLPAMSNELMAMVSGEPMIIPKSELSGPNTPSSVDSTSAGGGATSAFQISPHSVIKLQINPPPPPPPPMLPTHPNPPSSPMTGDATGKKTSPGKKTSLLTNALAAAAAANRIDRKVQREYHPDKHCGVWDNESKRHCTRALTCKSHSVLLKRKIPGRSKSFDDLVQQHKAQKEAQQVAAAAYAGTQQQMRAASRPPPGVVASATVESVLNSITEPNPIDHRFPLPNNGMRPKINTYVSALGHGAKMTAVATTVNGSKKSLLCLTSPPPLGAKESDENVIYTTDHPKPLAVCTFGGRRVGGLLVTDRSQFLTRKVVRVAITAGGFHRIRPQSRLNELKFSNNVIRRPVGGVTAAAVVTNTCIVTTPGMVATANNYLVNYSLTPTTVVQQQQLPQQPTARVIGTSVTMATAPPNLTLPPQLSRVAVNLAPLPPNATMVATTGLPPGIHMATTSDASFKTDIQNFKGGIKFEPGRNMKPILPTGSEMSK